MEFFQIEVPNLKKTERSDINNYSLFILQYSFHSVDMGMANSYIGGLIDLPVLMDLVTGG